jgi:hypothetical protein
MSLLIESRLLPLAVPIRTLKFAAVFGVAALSGTSLAYAEDLFRIRFE